MAPGLLNSGKHLEASALTSTASISVAPLMLPTTELVAQSLDLFSDLPSIGSSNTESESPAAASTSEEIADDETFAVDTIFTSGTFEIAAGGGNPDDSIFQGEINLAQMKMTRDNGTWSPEFWQASGSLGIDLNGLDISGTVDAAYYRAGRTVPGSVLTLPDIGSSNAESESTAPTETTEEIADDETFAVDTIFTSGTFEIAAGGGNPDDSIFQGEVELAQMKMTRDNGTWSPEFWQASGSLGIDLNGLDISGTVDAAYYRAGRTVPGSVLTLPDIGSSNESDASTELDSAATERETRKRKHRQRPQRRPTSQNRKQKRSPTTKPLLSTPSSPPAPLK